MVKRAISAPLWRRTFAYVIDALILAIIIWLPFNSIDEERQEIESLEDVWGAMQQEFSPRLFIIGLIAALLTVLYWAILEYKLQQTPGKMLMRLKVQPTQGKLTFKKCFLRNITKFSTLLLILDTAYMLKTPHKRFLDTIAHTEVIEIPRKR